MFGLDTICAVSTPAGEGGIGIIRLSGTDARKIAASVFRPRGAGSVIDMQSHTVRYGTIADPATDETVDEALVTVMGAPRSYTREDVVEIGCHGGMAPLWRTLRLLIAAGARQAEPGEFTKRAFLNGRIDLAQAEAVMDIIHASSELALRSAHEQLQGGLSRRVAEARERLLGILAGVEAEADFPEDEVEAASGTARADDIRKATGDIDSLTGNAAFSRIVREGVAAAIVGRPNVGKSSLMNALLQQDRAIVAAMPGTTRDTIEEGMTIDGVLVRIIDTAGIRQTHDMVEQEGVRRSVAAMERADLVIVVLDGSVELHDGDRKVLHDAREKRTIVAVNKSDLPRKAGMIEHAGPVIEISCTAGTGLEELRRSVADLVRSGVAGPRDHAWVVNERHRNELVLARAALEKAEASAREALSPELIALDLRDALDHLGMIVGTVTTDDVLERIFSDFCIGK